MIHQIQNISCGRHVVVSHFPKRSILLKTASFPKTATHVFKHIHEMEVELSWVLKAVMLVLGSQS